MLASNDDTSLRPPKKHSPTGRTYMLVRPGLWISAKRITASELPRRKQLQRLHRQQRWQQLPNQQRRTQQHPLQERRQAAEWCRSWAREPRSCCHRHSAPVQRQKRLKQVWSSSIDTPEIFNDKTIKAEHVSGLPPRRRPRF